MSYSRKYNEILAENLEKPIEVSYGYDKEGKIVIDVEVDKRIQSFRDRDFQTQINPRTNKTHSYSKSIDVLAEIPVEVNIHVDTIPFDESVEHCGNNVNLLTDSIVLTEVAEIKSKEENSQRVAGTVINGFFSYIRSEISQQVAELSQKIDATLMHLKELGNACSAKKKQMEGDYIRITGRYMKIFEDLNHELSNRIMELDRAAFFFKKETDNQKIRTSSNDLVNTVSIFGTENSDLVSKISSSFAKKRALDTIFKAKIFLMQQKKLNTTIQQSMLNENTACHIFAPVCMVESNLSNNIFYINVYGQEYLTDLSDNNKNKKLLDHFSSYSLNWVNMSAEDNASLKMYLSTEINKNMSTSDKHTERVKDMILKIADLSLVRVINHQQI
jgi:hypothetical protein